MDGCGWVQTRGKDVGGHCGGKQNGKSRTPEHGDGAELEEAESQSNTVGLSDRTVTGMG